MDRVKSGDLLMGDSPEVRGEVQSRALRRSSNANANLQKSLQLLDAAVGATPNPLLRSTRKTPLRHSAYTPRYTPSMQRLDVSSILGPVTPGHSIMATYGSSTDVSLPHTPGKHGSRIEEGASMDFQYTTTNTDLLLEEDPGLAASTELYFDFLQHLKNYSMDSQVFQLLSEYENLLSNQVSVLKKLVTKTTVGQTRFLRTYSTMDLLEEELHTWRLISSLYQDRLSTDTNVEDGEMAVDNYCKQSDKQIVEALYKRDATVRQAQLVVDWLERSAEDDLVACYDKVEFFSDRAGAWENTLHTLKQKERKVPMGLERSIVDEMDPDAPLRLGKPLLDLDREDDVRLLKYTFACIRAGQLEEAQRVCTKCGQSWRAATLEGWRLHHDSNVDTLGPGGEIRGIDGNPHRDIWKAVCWNMAEEEKFHKLERAIYAALSGNLRHLLPVCESWEDYLWAYMRVLIDTKVEQEIRVNTMTSRPLEALPANFSNKPLNIELIFQEIASCTKENVKQEAKEPYHQVQKYIILGDIDSLIEMLYDWCRNTVNRQPKHLVRFMAHLVLFLRSVGSHVKEELCTAILECYVQDLIKEKHTPLVATYVSKLPPGLQVEWYAKFLEEIREKEERQTVLNLAEEAGLDIPLITQMVVENVRAKGVTEFSPLSSAALDAPTTEEDREKIDAIDWLIFDPSQRLEAIRQANAIMRMFLAQRKHSATKEVFEKLPSNSIDTVRRNWLVQTGDNDLSPEDGNVIREYLCIQAYLNAHDSFNDWFSHFHYSKPVRPVPPPGASFTERVAHEHKEKQYEAELDRWRHALDMQTESAVSRMYTVLCFVNGGWMVDQDFPEDDVKDERRAHQMALLRQLCLPVISFLLHTVLQSTGQYQECLRLADVIASELHQLYKVFSKDHLRDFLHKLKESSVALLDEKLDPLGYAIS